MNLLLRCIPDARVWAIRSSRQFYNIEKHMTEEMPERSPLVPTHPTWQITRLICFAIILLSVISCVVIAAIRSNGLTQVTVTALDWDNEPRDPIVPFMNPREALPDYELVVIDSSGHKTNLGTRPNTSAVHGLSWQLNEPASVSEIVGLRLQDQDKVISDVITEVQVTSDTAAADGYRFDFQTEYSLSVGIQSFFRTPIGKTISAAFFVAMLIIIFSVFMV